MKPALPVTLRERKVVIGLIWFWSFTLYSFLGFLLETAYSRAVGGREDRKTLWVLPLCPVYGLGACAILLLPESVRRQLPLLFLFGGLIATTVEYGMAVIYERGLGVSFWDYTGMPGNVQGRVCLPFSMAWGVLAVVLVFSFIFGSSDSSEDSSYVNQPATGIPGQSTSLFDTSSLFESEDLFGAGGSYSGGTPSGSSQSVGSGGLLQPLPGTSTAVPAPTASPVEQSEPDTSISTGIRERFYTPLGKGNDTVTVMIYMCGTDLESKYGMATSDLSEMVKANLSDKVNVIVETGGCKAWKNGVVSSSVNQIYKVHKGGLERLEDNFGSEAMTDPDNLRDFIKYCNKNYPANRNILILWDHGGGSISGFGYDEKSAASGSMGLSKINQALTEANVKFDWIGFDACLMSTLETAYVCGNFADYLIASEEVEPGTAGTTPTGSTSFPATLLSPHWSLAGG